MRKIALSSHLNIFRINVERTFGFTDTFLLNLLIEDAIEVARPRNGSLST